MIEGQDELKSYIMQYYKKLFGEPDVGNFTLDESQTEGIPQVSEEENAFLTSPFTEEEVRKAVFAMEHNKAQVRMASQRNIINITGMSSSLTCWNFFVVCMVATWNCSVLTLGKLFCYLKLMM